MWKPLRWLRSVVWSNALQWWSVYCMFCFGHLYLCRRLKKSVPFCFSCLWKSVFYFYWVFFSISQLLVQRKERQKASMHSPSSCTDSLSDPRIRHKTNSRRHPKWQEIQYWIKRWQDAEIEPRGLASICFRHLLQRCLVQASLLPSEESRQKGWREGHRGSTQKGTPCIRKTSPIFSPSVKRLSL